MYVSKRNCLLTQKRKKRKKRKRFIESFHATTVFRILHMIWAMNQYLKVINNA